VPVFAFSNSTAEAALGVMLKFRDPALSKGSGQVEFNRSLDDVKRPIEPGLPQEILGRLETAANDNHLAWPFIPFPEGWYGA
jgi:hypothetical protein